MLRNNLALLAHTITLLLALTSSAQQGSQPSQAQDASVSRPETVTFPVTVLDEKKHRVEGLTAGDFTVYENDQAQPISSVSTGSGPVSVGILLDNSGSMRPKQGAISRALVRLLESEGPQDQYFLVAFSDESSLVQDFTNDKARAIEAMRGLAPRGGSALYDALIASSDYLTKEGRNFRKVLVLVTDGEDNESRNSLDKTIAVLRANGTAVYAVALLQESDGPHRRGVKTLERISSETNGAVFFPRNMSKLEEACQEAARDMSGQYLIAYRPTVALSGGGIRKVRVEANAPGHKRAIVQTITVYSAGTETAH